MSEKTAINVCVDSELLTQAGILFKNFGLDTVSAFESLLRQAIKNPKLLSPEPVTPKTSTPAYKFTKESKKIAELIELAFDQYGVSVKPIDLIPGPVVTTVKIRPAAGVASGQIIASSEAVAKDLARRKIRVIEGKDSDCVGLEIPNPSDSVKPIDLIELVNSGAFEDSESSLPIALGRTTTGEPFVFDLVKARHLLIGGTMESGKTICLHTIIMSLLFKNNPPDLRLVLIDPKALEFVVYESNPYLLTPVITEPQESRQALKWLVKEMERRFEIMKAIGVHNIRDLNEKLEASPIMDSTSTEKEPRALKKLPYLVIVIDELVDLLLTNREVVESLILQLMQKGGVVGIHLVIATQCLSADSLPLTIKDNCPTRIAFKVANRHDSAVLINQSGAEDLLGSGDMFFMTPGSPLTRVHGAIIDCKYINGLSAFLWAQLESKYIDLTVDDEEEDSDSSDETNDIHIFYDLAVQMVITERKASISHLQRKLGIGYGRAAKLVGKMEAEGIVSKPTVNGRRRVLVGSDYIPNSKN